GKPFVKLLPSGTFPDSKHVVGSNRVDISAVLDDRTGRFLLTSAEDNLLKGASGQAIQIANLRFGFPETAGLL
ncbi:MAG: N-acetyl-gamma-glutamyl-phosphate reductase, partial [Opitutae bacterium]